MAIQSIPGTKPAQQTRGTNSSNPLTVKDEENQHKAVIESSTEFWIGVINFLSYVILIASILVDCVSLSLIQYGTAYTLGPIFLTLVLLGLTAYATLEMVTSPISFSLMTKMATFTFVFLISCLIYTGLSIGKEYIRLPSCWNMSNTNNEHCIATQESFTYGLKPASYSYNHWYFHFYDILATMNNRVLSLNATKEFLKKYDCDKNWLFPPLAIQNVSIFGLMGTSDFYPVSNLACGPE